MRYNEAFRIVVFTLLLASCKKDHTTNPPTPPPPDPVKKVLLKDITIPNLPSPYYHLEYNSDSMITKVDFSKKPFTVWAGDKSYQSESIIISTGATAKLLGLPYPGGPLIDKFAATGNANRFKFPEPQIPGLNFSFSGLKTSILYFLKNAGESNVYKEEFIADEATKQKFIEENLPDICASIQNRIVSILLNKLKKAAVATGIKNICIAGGVSANSGLRNAFAKTGEELGWKTFIPAFEYCTDNAAMIAITGYYKYLNNDFASLDVSPTARAEW